MELRLRLFGVTFLLLAAVCSLSAQYECNFSGKVKDLSTGKEIAGAAVSVLGTNVGELTDSLGRFNFCHLPKGNYKLVIESMGYSNDTVCINLKDSISMLDIRLKPQDIVLKEVFVKVLSPIFYHRGEFLEKPAISFANYLDIIPGATVMSIGAGMAKPVVRGLGYNRVAVINRGVVQQNQQWGADHGLEINQFDMSSATVYKGPYALLLGAGSPTAIDIVPYGFTGKNEYYKGEAILFGATNNDLYGGGLITEIQQGKWYGRGTFSYKDYAAYRVPANMALYNGEEIILQDKRVPNTAGREIALSGTLGYRNKGITSYFNISNNYQKNGLFELEHDHDDHNHGDHDHSHEGEDHTHSHDHDHDAAISHRNIAMPYSTSNHFTVSNNTEWKKNTSLRLLVNAGYQFNNRREYEHFHEHYEGQPAPVTTGNLAVHFKLHTYSLNTRLYLDEKEKWTKTLGANVEYQQNRIGGYEYFLPRYNQVTGGLAFINGFTLSDKVSLEAGLRYDIGHMDITGFYDNDLASYLTEEGYSGQLVGQYAQRAYPVNKNFGAWSANIGMKYQQQTNGEGLTLKMNMGKTYRFPSANELAANGVHHAAFRYEIGDPELKPESGYTADWELSYFNNDMGRLYVMINPFVTYYTDFIYLQSVTESKIELYEESPYKYMQADALFGGGEYKITWMPLDKLELSSGGSYVINKNLDDHNPLPFTPPFTMRNEIKFFNGYISNKKISYYQFTIGHHLYARQGRVGVAEEKTSGTNLFNASAGIVYKINSNLSLDINMQVQNIFDTRYFNHMSLYRRLNIPEPGRNFQLFIRLPFKS